MPHHRLTQRLAATVLSITVLGSGLVSPVAAAEPVPSEPASSSAPSEPAPTESTPTPSPEPSPSATSVDEPRTDALDPADEVLELRTADSQTYEVAPGEFITESSSMPLFYRPDGSDEWRPIDATLRAVSDGDVTARSDRAPVTVSLRTADHAAGFLTVERADHSISFRLPSGTPAGRAGATAQVQDTGRRADFSDLLPGGIGLRVFPRADGVKSFLVLQAAPARTSFTFAVSALGLTAAEEEDGSIAFRDAAGETVAAIPAPYVLDSSGGPDDGYSAEAVSLGLGGSPSEPTVTLSVDRAYLATATYPVFVDPTVTVFGKDAGTDTAVDTFISSTNSGVNYNGWTEAGGTASLRIGYNSGNGSDLRALVRFANLASTIPDAHIDLAQLKLRPYWQQSGSTSSASYVRSITSSWASDSVTWDTAPTLTDNIVPDSANSSQGQDIVFDVTDNVQDIVDGVFTHHGFLVRGVGGDSTTYKKLLAAESGDNNRPRLRVEWHRPIATPTAPANGVASESQIMRWSYDDGDPTATRPQTAFEVQHATSSDFADAIGSGVVTSPDSFWPIDVTLSDGQQYYWRVRVFDGVGWSSWPATRSFIFDWTDPRDLVFEDGSVVTWASIVNDPDVIADRSAVPEGGWVSPLDDGLTAENEDDGPSNGPDGQIGENFSMWEVNDTTRHPYRDVGIFHRSDGSQYCSGFFWRARVVITAAHCLYSIGSGAYTTAAHHFHPMQDGPYSYPAAPDGCDVVPLKRSVPRGFMNGQEGFDFGAVRLSCAYTGRGVGVAPDYDPPLGTDVWVVGYPAPKTGYPINGHTMYQSYGKIRHKSLVGGRPLLGYTADTLGGSSGSPVFRKKVAIVNGQARVSYQVVAVHSGGPYAHCSELNCGRRVDQNVLDYLSYWKLLWD